MKAYILITAEVGSTPQVQEQLRNVSADGVLVKDVDLVAGAYDIIMVVEAANPKLIGQLVLHQLHQIKGISHTVTNLEL